MKIAVIGLGYWGPNLLRNLYESNLCEQLYCCDIDDGKIAKIKSRYPTIHATNDYRELVRNDEIDGVVIATTVATHYELTKDFLTADKHVFVEKPITTDVKEAETLVKMAKEKNRVLMVGHTFEYSPPVIKIKEISFFKMCFMELSFF